MKKFFLLALTAAFAVNGIAQDKGLKGTWFVTSQLGYTQTKTGDVKSTNLTVLPIVGTFITPSVAVGGAVGYASIKSEDGSTTEANTGLLVIEPLVRKYYNINGGLFFFGQLAAPVISGKEKESETKVSQFGLAASGGLDFVMGKHFTVEFSYNLINASVTTITPKAGDKTTITDFSVAHVANVSPEYNAALGGSNPTLTSPLSFGFKFLF
ncbi:MAG: outer membrane beta-barrel protein [Ferruginibacter sp.]